jgi:hypothetical protein
MRLAGPERAFVKKSRRGLEWGMRGKYPLRPTGNTWKGYFGRYLPVCYGTRGFAGRSFGGAGNGTYWTLGRRRPSCAKRCMNS